MKDLNIPEQLNWREYAKERLEKNVVAVKDYRDGESFDKYAERIVMGDTSVYKEKVYVFNPVEHFNYIKPTHKSKKEILNFELYNVRKSDLMIVYFNKPDSIGAAIEMAIAYENKIPIIGVFEQYVEQAEDNIHAWLSELCDVIFTDLDECIDYIKEHYLYE